MINKGCEVNYDFKNGFIMSEEHLQTVSSMISDRYPGETVIYRLTKSNSYIYQTTNIEEIVKEENGNANLINKLEIILINNDKIDFCLCFEKGGQSFLTITGTDKDVIFLLYNEIKTYVEKEITTVKTFFSRDVLYSICSFASVSLMLTFLFLFISANFIPEELKEVIDSSDVLIKLNYLITRQSEAQQMAERFMYKHIPLFLVSIVLLFLPKLINLLWGKTGILRITDYFLFGKQKNIYEKKVKVRSNILWTGFIGLLVSTIAGILVYLFTK